MRALGIEVHARASLRARTVLPCADSRAECTAIKCGGDCHFKRALEQGNILQNTMSSWDVKEK